MPPTQTNSSYDLPVGVGGSFTANGAITSGALAGQQAGTAANNYTVTSASTAPTTPTTYQQPQYPPQYDTSTLATNYTPLTETPQEQQQSALSSRIQSINDQLAGKSAAQTQANASAGVDSINQAIADNTTALKQLQNESAAAKIKAGGEQAPSFIVSGEQGAIDRSAAIKALTLSSISDGLQNNLVSAQHKADAAVAQQYGPLEAELAAKTANLKTIQNDPATSLADKNRAAQQQLVLNKQAADIAQQKQNTADVQKLAIEGATNAKNFVPTKQYPSLSVALQAIATAKDPVTATQIATASGLITPAKLDTSVVEINGRKVLVNNQNGATVKDLGSATTGGTTPGGIAKGRLTDKGFVNKVLSSQGIAYQDAVGQVPQGKIGVIDNKSGAVGTIDPGEFDSAKYTKL